jgi:hypothetical protein
MTQEETDALADVRDLIGIPGGLAARSGQRLAVWGSTDYGTKFRVEVLRVIVRFLVECDIQPPEWGQARDRAGWQGTFDRLVVFSAEGAP